MPSSERPSTPAAAAGPAAGKDVRSARERIERRLWRAWKPLQHRLTRAKPCLRVFVAGMQRSGTNMLMETLEWSAHADIYHETDERAFDEYQMRPRETVRELTSCSRAPFFIIKSLCELDQIRSLMDDFAPAKTLWIVRAVDDTVNSAIRSFGHFASQVQRLAKDKSAAGWRGRGMSDDTQALLRRFDHPGLTDASGAALMWYYRNVLLFEQGLDRDPRVRVIRYENLVSDPGAQLREVFRFVGLPDASPWISRYVHPKSVGKSPRADIDPDIRVVCEGLQARLDSMSESRVAAPAACP